jgi:hypothetical protein
MNTIGGFGFFLPGVPGTFSSGVPGTLRDSATAPGAAPVPDTRPAAAPGTAIRLDLTGADPEVRLREELIQVVGVLHRDAAGRDAVVGRMMDALRDRLDGAQAVEIRLASLQVDHGGVATVSQPVVETGIVRDGHVASRDAAVFGLDGRSVGLDAEAVVEGWRRGTFTTRLDLPPAPAADAGLQAAREALERLRALRNRFWMS